VTAGDSVRIGTICTAAAQE